MKFSKFFSDFTASLSGSSPEEPCLPFEHCIQFSRLKKVLRMISEGWNASILSKEELEIGLKCESDPIRLFVTLLSLQMDQVDAYYLATVRALPRRLRASYNGADSQDAEAASPGEEISLERALEPYSELFFSLADETLRLGNFAYMNFTATRKILKKFVKLNPPVTAISDLKRKFEEMHYVVDQGRVRNLLSSMMPGLNIQASNAMLQATRSNDMEEVRRLILLQGANVNHRSPSDGRTALHVASSLALDKVVELLIGLKADVTILDCYGESPLSVALTDDASPALECARLLHQVGADIVLPADVTILSNLKFRAFDAAKTGNLPRLEKLWTAGVSMLDAAESVLHLACANGQIPVVKFLLQYNVVPTNQFDRLGKTPLEVIPTDADEELVRLLLGRTATPTTTAVAVGKRLEILLGGKIKSPSSPDEGLTPVSPKQIKGKIIDTLTSILGRKSSASFHDEIIGGLDIEKAIDRKLTGLDSVPVSPWMHMQAIVGQVFRKVRPYLHPVWLQDYDWKRDFRADLLAGISLTGLFIPGSMALATLIGIDAVYGIYSGLLSAVVYAYFCSSRHLAVGPLSVVSLLVGDAFVDLEGGATPARAVLFCVEVGIIFVVLGTLRMGFLAKFLSAPALAGFTTAAAILTSVAQLSGLLGTTIKSRSSLLLHNIIWRNLVALPSAKWQTVLVSILGMSVIVLLRKHLPSNVQMLASMITMFLMIAMSAIFNFDAHGIKTVGHIQAGLPQFTAPGPSFSDAWTLLPSAFFVGLVGFIESVASAKTWAQKFGYKIDNDRELVVLGMSNLVMPLTGGFPVFGSLSASAANVELGGKSPMTLVVRSCLLLLVLLAFAPIFAPLPKNILSVILIMTVYKMIDFSAVPKLWTASKSDLAVWVSACGLTLFLGVDVGMATAAGLSLLVFIARTSKPRIIVMAREIGSLHFVPVDQQHEHAIDKKGVLVLSFQAPLWYANAELLKDKAVTLLTTEKIHTIVVEMSAVSFADTTAVETLRELHDQVTRMNKQVVLCNLNVRVVKTLKTNRLLEHFNGMNSVNAEFPDSIYEAIRRANILQAMRKKLSRTSSAENQVKIA